MEYLRTNFRGNRICCIHVYQKLLKISKCTESYISACLFSKKEEKSSGPDMRLIHNNANYCTILHYLIFTLYYLVLDGISERILSTTLHKGFTENHTIQKNISVQLIFFY